MSLRAQKEHTKIKAELEEMLSKVGWKWAVLTSTMGKLYQEGESVPTNLINQIRMTRTQIESGCYSVCDITNELREIEKYLFSKLLKFGPKATDHFLGLLGKAISGKISNKDLTTNQYLNSQS